MNEIVNDKNSWSVDRIDYNKGYVNRNMGLCTTLTNNVKGRIEYTIEKSLKQLANAYGQETALRAITNILITVLEVQYNSLLSKKTATL
jgi:hypothetical protein